MPLTVKDRFEIIFLATHPLGPKLPPSGIAKYKKISKSTVRHWLKKYRETGEVEDETGKGRKRATSAGDEKKIIALATGQKRPSSKEIMVKLQEQGKQISASTIQRRLREAGMRYGPPLRKPVLTATHRKQRLAWAKQHRQQSWDNVIFSDESTIYLNSHHRNVWQPKGRRFVIRTVKHPRKVNFWGCFSAKGFGRVYTFTDNMNADKLVRIYKKALLPSAAAHFPDPSKPWVLQEDNDPKHTSRKARNWRDRNQVNRMEWPAQSPDLAPIENAWAILKANVAHRRPKTIAGLRRIVEQEWNKLSKELARKLVDSMKDRLEAVIQSKGDYILY